METKRHTHSRRSPFPTHRLMLVSVLYISIHSTAFGAGINKCVTNGITTYQDAPCVEDTVAESYRRKDYNQRMHHHLDQLQAQGAGMVDLAPRPKPPAEAEPDKPEQSKLYVPKSRSELKAERERQDALYQKKSEKKNAETVKKLGNIIEEAKKACGGQLFDYPGVGMSDETFRSCTKHARFGGVKQIVVSKDGEVPLRLYVFDSERAKKVYSIDGVITAVKP